MASFTGSGSRPGPTSVRAATSPSRGSASSTRAARRSAPACHHESSSLNATYGVRARQTPAFRAAAPALRASATTSTPGKHRAAASALPSAEPLSTTMTAGRSGSAVSRPSVRSNSSRRLRVATTTVTRAGSAVRKSIRSALPPPGAGKPQRERVPEEVYARPAVTRLPKTGRRRPRPGLGQFARRRGLSAGRPRERRKRPGQVLTLRPDVDDRDPVTLSPRLQVLGNSPRSRSSLPRESGRSRYSVIYLTTCSASYRAQRPARRGRREGNLRLTSRWRPGAARSAPPKSPQPPSSPSRSHQAGPAEDVKPRRLATPDREADVLAGASHVRSADCRVGQAHHPAGRTDIMEPTANVRQPAPPDRSTAVDSIKTDVEEIRERALR